MKTGNYILEENITVYCIDAERFPEGVQAAHEKLHGLVKFSPERKYYGISFPRNGKIIYKAAATELNKGELSRHGLEAFRIPKGNYIFIDVPDFRKNLDQITRVFDELTKDSRIDPKGFCLEWYLSDTLCRCMIKTK